MIQTVYSGVVFVIVCTLTSSTSKSTNISELHRTRRQSQDAERAGCRMPPLQQNGQFSHSQRRCPPDNTIPLCQMTPGSPVPHNWPLYHSCDPGYVLNPSRTTASVCLDGVWRPTLPSCIRLCYPLKSTKAKLKCVFRGQEVSCDKDMKPGTTAKADCPQFYRSNFLMVCLDDGLWAHVIRPSHTSQTPMVPQGTDNVFRCVPEQYSQPKGDNHVFCYYTYWSASRKSPYDFKPEDVDPFLCTHIIYAFVIFGKNYDFDKSEGNFKELYPRMIALKKTNPELKVMVAPGGWREGSTGFPEITKDQESRMKFARNVVTFLRETDFDGIDLNWQHPTFRVGGKPEDKENYVLLAQALREEFEKEAMKTGRPRLLLAISIAQSMKALPAYDIRSFNVYMDFISVLCYDYVFSYTSTVKHHAPLYAIPNSPDYEKDKTLTINYTINYLLEQADANKLVLGIPTFGRSKKLVDPNDTDLGAEADGAGMKGPYTGENGFLAYFEICLKVNNENWTVAQTLPYGTVGPHAFKGNQWVSYDDVEMVRTKARYAKQRGLAGVVFWTIDYDDFQGTCGRERCPLIYAAKDELSKTSAESGTR